MVVRWQVLDRCLNNGYLIPAYLFTRHEATTDRDTNIFTSRWPGTIETWRSLWSLKYHGNPMSGYGVYTH